MTEKIKSKRGACVSGEVLFSLCSIAVLLLAFAFSGEVLEAMKRGMKLCVSTVIPSLFPFSVLCELTARSGAADGIARIFGGVFEKLFGIRRVGALALILGVSCGFPIGTRCAISLYERGRIDHDELERLLCFCNGPSPAFLIGGIGASMFGSREFGIMLFVSELISCVAVGVLFRWLGGKRMGGERLVACTNEKRLGIAEHITLAVSESAKSMILVCAFIIFFSAFGGIVGKCLLSFGASRSVSALVLGILELTGGALAASELAPPASCLLVAAIVGWSGLSVHFQFVSICSEHKIRLGHYFAARICRAAIDCALVALGLRLFSDRITIHSGAAESFLVSGEIDLFGTVGIFAFVLGVLNLRGEIKRRKN